VAELNSPGFVAAKLAKWLQAPANTGWNQRTLLLALAAGTGLFFLLKNGLFLWMYHRQAVVKCRILGSLARMLLGGYLHAPYAWHLGHSTTVILHNIQHELNAIFFRLISPLLTITAEAAVVLFVIGLLLVVSPVATLVILVLVFGAFFLYLKIFRERLQRMGQVLNERRTLLYRCLQDSLGGIKELKVLGRLGFFERQFDGLIDNVAQAEEFNIQVSANVKPLMETLAVTVLCVLVAVLVLLQQRPQAVLPGLALFAVATVRLMPSANRLFGAQSQMRFGRAGLERVLSDLEEVRDFAAAALVRPEISPVPVRFEQAIELTNVGYRYPQAERDSLEEICLTIRRGQSVALVGESGAGKTTLVDLILGLLPPGRGTIRVDGRDIQEFIPAWQRQIGYIPQVIYLAEDTLRVNVAFGVPEAEIDDARVWRALEAAQLAELVRSWPERLDRLIGERGVRLSGGQRQRIGIARAFYHDPAILILDEATAALDNETEREIVSVLEQFRGEKTLMTIAHRLTTVQHCDTIFLLSRGRIVAQGSYDALQRESPEFQRMIQAAGRPRTAGAVAG
jgi:ATP-binding cassette subfamily C protein